MGFLKKAATAYPAKRNRINQQQQQQQQTTVGNYGVQDPTPMPSSVYQANGMTVAPPTHATAAVYSAPTTTAQQSHQRPVVATAYVPGQTNTTSSPVVATAYVSGSNAGQPHSNASTPATAYTPSYAASAPQLDPFPPPVAPQTSGNHNYNSNESKFWECSRCTFPNLRTEAQCKGCGGSIPPGMLRPGSSPATASVVAPTASTVVSTQYSYAAPVVHGYNNNNNHSANVNQMTNQMNNLHVHNTANTNSNVTNTSSGVMRVHVPSGMQPGQKIKVRSPDGKEVVKAIPPRHEWLMDGNKPFFRMQFGSNINTTPVTSVVHASSSYTSNNSYSPTTTITSRPPPYQTTWRSFHPTAPSAYSPPPIGMRRIPNTPRGSIGIPPNGRHKALIIGINYTGTRAALKGCVNDAKSMQQLLMRNGFGDDGSHMLLLTDERSRGREYQPNATNIMKAFAWFMKDVQKGDVLFFHFSGHGGQVPDKTGHEADGFNETIVPLDYERAGQISDDVLWGSLVYPMPEGCRLIALMDMCHSGTGLDLPFDYNVDTRRWKEDVNPAHSPGDVVLFSGCEDAQTSADVQSGWKAGGAMTMAFTKAYQQSQMASYHDFLSMVKRELRKRGHRQRPQMTSSQQFDANSRIFSLGHEGSGVPSVIEANHNPQVGRQMNRRVRPGRQGFGGGGGGGGNIFNLAAAGVGAALFADAIGLF
jgi:hypothetical protein